MASRHPLAPARLLAVFAILAGVPLVALGWLAYRVVQQDRALERKGLHERLDNAASLLARELDRGLAAWEDLLPAAARGEPVALPVGAVFLSFGDDGVARQGGMRLPYYPRVEQPSTTMSQLFAAAEAHEFRDGNLAAATAAYRDLAAARQESVRAEALVRLARCLRKQRQPQEAIAAYERLATLGGVIVAGSPAELIARRERIALFGATGRSDAASQERLLLNAALADGRFRIDKATFEYFHETAPSRPAAALPLAEAVQALWPAWTAQPAGRHIWTGGGATFVSVSRVTPSGKASITAPVDALTASIAAALRSLQVAAQLDNHSGITIWGGTTGDPRATRTARETGLPWTLHVSAADASAEGRLIDSRRNLFVAGFMLMALVICAAGYFVFRAVSRELGVARLQSDFVAAVSHEFRAPLTAMCHLTEMLEDGDASPDRVPDYYGALGRESRRLRAMVENLLDFGRIDSGRRTYEFEEIDAVQLVAHVAEEYTERSPAAARRIEQSLPAREDIVVRADREALALAVRNLLDNAMKYSPESAPVRLAVSRSNGTVAMSVEDRGAGIGPQDRRDIFRKFSRGVAAKALNVKGTGIGLTMADQIVRAHGGRLQLESQPGRGSTFTIVLPALAS
jgi:signal transduction histidine kinase